MSGTTQVTVFVLESVHAPTTQEVNNMSEAIIAGAEQQGFEPLRMRTVYQGHDSNTERGTLEASCQVNDGVVAARWRKL